jgi:hypothetical protein
MLLNRFARTALGLFLILSAGPAFGQGLRGLQLFAPADVSTMGGPLKANEGFFFTYDGLFWSTTPPRVAPIGNQDIPTRDTFVMGPGATGPLLLVQTNTEDTGFLKAKFEGGQRFEIGRVVEHNGWMVGVTQLQDQDQAFSFQNIQMVVNDPPQGTPAQGLLDGNIQPLPPPFLTENIKPLPLVWDTLSGMNSTRYWSVELMYIYRTEQMHDNGYCEFFFGPRYFQFDDSFNVTATGGILADSFWNTNAENHVIAGQVGARWFRKTGRWMFSSEGRFWAGLNCQNFSNEGELGSLLVKPAPVRSPILMFPTAFSKTLFERDFNPGVELRLDLRYQLTQAISLRFGWSGMWMDRINRASDIIDYTIQRSGAGVPAGFGILEDRNKQSVFINGLTIGLDINR